jgi:hypothetical protein
MPTKAKHVAKAKRTLLSSVGCSYFRHLPGGCKEEAQAGYKECQRGCKDPAGEGHAHREFHSYAARVALAPIRALVRQSTDTDVLPVI